MTNLVVGEVVTATRMNALLQAAAAGVVAYKTSTTARASTTTLADDPHLTVSVEANSVYQVDMLLFLNGASGGDFKMLTVCAGSTFPHYFLALTTSGGTFSDPMDHGAATDHSTDARGTWGTPDGTQLKGTLTTTTAGTFKVQWAQNASNATATQLLVGSRMTLKKIG